MLFADIKGSMEVFADRDPEAAQKLFEPVLERMIEAVHHYEGTVNRSWATASCPSSARRSPTRIMRCALVMRGFGCKRPSADMLTRLSGPDGVPVSIRVGLNSGEIVVCAIGNDLHIDYTVVGQTANLAARLEQMAQPGSDPYNLCHPPIGGRLHRHESSRRHVGEGAPRSGANLRVTGVGAARTCLDVAAERGFTRFVGRDIELEQLRRVQQLAGQGRGQVAAIVGEAGVGKSRLVREFFHSQNTADWLVLEFKSVSYGHATPYLPIIELLRDYFKINVRDSTQSIRETVTGRILALDASLQDAIPRFWTFLISRMTIIRSGLST